VSRRVTVVITCDHPACPATYTGPAGQATTQAGQAGWLVSPAIDACPAHWNRTQGEPK
jgi:hypothetical protein